MAQGFATETLRVYSLMIYEGLGLNSSYQHNRLGVEGLIARMVLGFLVPNLQPWFTQLPNRPKP